MRDNERRGQNQPGRRYFDVDFGIRYTIVATDEWHALLLLRESDADFEETLAELGEPDFVELTPDQITARRLYDDGSGPYPITEFPLGTVASSEF